MPKSKFLLLGVLLIISISLVPSVLATDANPDSTPELAIIKEFENEQLSRPTFGINHENLAKAVDYGFKFNEKNFFISDNFHTPFEEHFIKTGELNSFEANVYAPNGLRVQEFLFGIPEIGQAHNAELGIEVWYNHEGQIENIVTVQSTNVVDEDQILAFHEKTKCKTSSFDKKCDSTQVSVMFLEPLKDKIIAIKAIDFTGRYQITYLNDGMDISGQSMNPLQTVWISSPVKNEGLIQLTQTQKYSIIWTSEGGKIFERNSFGSFKQINHTFERFQDSGDPTNRMHSEFGKLIEHEKVKASLIFNSTNLFSELPETFAYSYPDPKPRIDDKIQQQMLEQQKLAQKILEGSQLQARFSNINS